VTIVTDGSSTPSWSSVKSQGVALMERPSTARTVYELAIAGEQAGMSPEQLIQLLIAEVGADALCHLLELRLVEADSGTARSSRWMM
jgi:hypothetical protein